MKYHDSISERLLLDNKRKHLAWKECSTYSTTTFIVRQKCNYMHLPKKNDYDSDTPFDWLKK